MHQNLKLEVIKATIAEAKADADILLKKLIVEKMQGQCGHATLFALDAKTTDISELAKARNRLLKKHPKLVKA